MLKASNYFYLQINLAFSYYRYSALATDMDLLAVALWRLYHGCAERENRIKKLKYDLDGESYNLKNFCATEAAFADSYVDLQFDALVSVEAY